MRICVFGAGAVGGHFAAKLAAAGHDVSVVVRGPNLTAIRKNGITLRIGERQIHGRVTASDRPSDLGTQDVVISTLKAPGLPGLAAGIAPLLGAATGVVFAQNGIPWWYPLGLSPSRPKPPDLSRLDPSGVLARAIASERVIGGVIHSSNEVIAPGIVSNDAPHRATLVIGEADDRPSPRIAALRDAFESAGIQSPPVSDIRKAIWNKLMINMAASTLSLLTGQKATIVGRDPALGEIFVRAYREALAIAAAHGIDFGSDAPVPEALRPNMPDHLPSIRQDYDRGRMMEIDALVLAPQRFARAAGIATPTFDVIAAVAARLATEKGLYQP
jgi:2-dehydropantoate 2-reductase